MSKEIYLEDNLFDKQDIIYERHTVRVIIENDEGKYGYIRIKGSDIFGERNHLESCGGGIEKGESQLDTLHREVKEEMGCTCEVIAYLGTIVHDFNVIQRRTYAYYYFVRLLDDKMNTELTDLEKTLFDSIEWLTLEEVKYELSLPNSKIGTLVHQRELIALELFEQEILNK